MKPSCYSFRRNEFTITTIEIMLHSSRTAFLKSEGPPIVSSAWLYFLQLTWKFTQEDTRRRLIGLNVVVFVFVLVVVLTIK